MNNLPWSVRWLGYLIPFTYAQRAIKPMLADMSGIPSHLSEFTVLILYGLLLLILSSLTLKQRE